MEQSRLLTFVVFALLAWLLVTVFRVVADMNSIWTATGDPIGPTAMGGIMGILVMLGLVVLFVVYFSELGSAGPGPSTWPPEE